MEEGGRGGTGGNEDGGGKAEAEEEEMAGGGKAEAEEEEEVVGEGIEVVMLSQLHFGHNADVKEPLKPFFAFDNLSVMLEKKPPFPLFILY